MHISFEWFQTKLCEVPPRFGIPPAFRVRHGLGSKTQFQFPRPAAPANESGRVTDRSALVPATACPDRTAPRACTERLRLRRAHPPPHSNPCKQEAPTGFCSTHGNSAPVRVAQNREMVRHFHRVGVARVEHSPQVERGRRKQSRKEISVWFPSASGTSGPPHCDRTCGSL